MNSNTITLRFGIDPNNFKPVDISPVKSDTGFIYFLEQNTDEIPCPFCNSIKQVTINGYHSKILDLKAYLMFLLKALIT